MCIYVQICDYSLHVCTVKEYVCYVGRLKCSMYLVDMKLVVRNAAKAKQI